MRILIGSLLALALTAGCVDTITDEEAKVEQERRAANVREDTVFDPMIGTMDRARGVEDLSAGRMDDLNRQLEASE
jgi:hypothetical protein